MHGRFFESVSCPRTLCFIYIDIYEKTKLLIWHKFVFFFFLMDPSETMQNEEPAAVNITKIRPHELCLAQV